jgi:hypothetical protein
MYNPLLLAAKRFGRTLVGYAVAFVLWYLSIKISQLPVPEILVPVVAAIINAIGKYIRDTLKIRVPF